MNTTTFKRKDDSTDLEQQFILRLPQAVADTLRNDISSGTTSIKDKLSIELHIDTRNGKVIYDGHLYNAKLVDLPCIIESLKTMDKKTFYKTADICQMLVCKNEFEEASLESVTGEENTKTQKEKDKEIHSNHGVCPPFKNVRKRRFRKTLQKKVQDQPDIEKELRRLLSMDAQAIDVKWQVVTDHQPQDTKMNNQQILNIGSKEIFGEVSSSSDEDSKLITEESQTNVSTQNIENKSMNEEQTLNLEVKENILTNLNKIDFKIESTD